jgi:hypothetical protein
MLAYNYAQEILTLQDVKIEKLKILKKFKGFT